MKRALVILAGLAVAIGLAVAAPAAKGDAAAGKALFAKKCAGCHGPSGEGKEALAKMLKTTMRDLGSAEVQAKSDDELAKNITEGTGKMKPVKDASAGDVANVVAFIRTLKKK